MNFFQPNLALTAQLSKVGFSTRSNSDDKYCPNLYDKIIS